jgi:hypothetical protein
MSIIVSNWLEPLLYRVCHRGCSSDCCRFPRSVLFRTVTRARELIEAEGVSDDASKLKCVIIPVDLDMLDASERRAGQIASRAHANLYANPNNRQLSAGRKPQ